nr:arp2/3 complex-activating protein rickA [Aegilops tauschii subsp. strangulata]
MAPVSTVGIKRSAPSDDDEQPSIWCKGSSSHQAHQNTFKGKQVVDPEDHGGDKANKRKWHRCLAIDINAVPHNKDDDDLDNPLHVGSPAAGGRFSQPPHWLLSLVNKKQAQENKILELAEQRLHWATKQLMEEIELKKMQLENEKMRLENIRLQITSDHRRRVVFLRSPIGEKKEKLPHPAPNLTSPDPIWPLPQTASRHRRLPPRPAPPPGPGHLQRRGHPPPGTPHAAVVAPTAASPARKPSQCSGHHLHPPVQPPAPATRTTAPQLHRPPDSWIHWHRRRRPNLRLPLSPASSPDHLAAARRRLRSSPAFLPCFHRGGGLRLPSTATATCPRAPPRPAHVSRCLNTFTAPHSRGMSPGAVVGVLNRLHYLLLAPCRWIQGTVWCAISFLDGAPSRPPSARSSASRPPPRLPCVLTTSAASPPTPSECALSKA